MLASTACLAFGSAHNNATGRWKRFVIMPRYKKSNCIHTTLEDSGLEQHGCILPLVMPHPVNSEIYARDGMNTTLASRLPFTLPISSIRFSKTLTSFCPAVTSGPQSSTVGPGLARPPCHVACHEVCLATDSDGGPAIIGSR